MSTQTGPRVPFNDRVVLWSDFCDTHLARVYYIKSEQHHRVEVTSKQTLHVVDVYTCLSEDEAIKNGQRLLADAKATNKLVPDGHSVPSDEQLQVGYLLSRMLQKTFLNRVWQRTHINGMPVRDRKEVIAEIYNQEKAKEAAEKTTPKYGPKK